MSGSCQRHPHLRGGLATHRIGNRTIDLRGIGGDPIIGTNFIDVLKLFEQDPQTRAVIMMGETANLRRGSGQFIQEI
jgi:succinyl-CoA synthetase alpha subunit